MSTPRDRNTRMARSGFREAPDPRQPSPAWQRPWGARPLARVLGGLDGSLRDDLLLARIDDIWNDLVGPQIAGLTEVEEVAGGELRVRVSHPVWRTELGGLAEEIRRRLVERLEEGGLEDAGARLRRVRLV
jgi:hypothetical protein